MMALPTGFELATDAEFRIMAGFAEPPKAGRVLDVEPSGQLRIELDDADGGEVLAWPLNGFEYAAGAVVYVGFAANSPESGIVLGSKAPVPGLDDLVLAAYARLAGRSGGQHLRGGMASGNDLTLESTSHATKGALHLQPNGGKVWIGQDTAGTGLDVRTATSDQGIVSRGARPIIRLYKEGSEPVWLSNTGFQGQGDHGGTGKIFEMWNNGPSIVFVIQGNGNVGVGIAEPPTRFYAALEAGGGKADSSVALTSTGAWVNVLPSGTVGDLLQLRAVVRRSGHAAVVSESIALGAPSTTIYNNGGNTVLAEVTSGGVFRVQRSAGSATLTVALDMLWV